MTTMASVLLLLALSTTAAATKDDYEITSLPGLEATLSFKQYAGLMPLQDDAGTEMFFWFVESQRNPREDPVVFWTNGGPGSSSVAYGFWTEHGPFRLERNNAGQVVPAVYDYSWNRIANVVYLEMPTGVGFSSSRDPAAYTNITDEQSAIESHTFLRRFFEVFSDFKSNPFYVTGESYGGHYVPNLSEKLLDDDLGLDVKGFLIGNPGINSDWYYNVNEYAFVTFMWSHGLIPAREYLDAHTVCGWERFFTNCTEDFTHPSAECQNATAAAVSLIPKPLDLYDVLAPTCQSNSQRAHVPFVRHMREKYGIETYDPCITDLTPEYINSPEVMKALHIDTTDRTWPQTPREWSYNQGSAGEKKDIRQLFPRFFKEAPAWKIWVVSGTADAAVPFLGTERWMNCLGRKRVGEYRPWYVNKDVAGMVMDWEGISLVTVKGCGHTIPTYCPEKGYVFFSNYLAA